MTHVLHLLKAPARDLALAAIRQESREPDTTLTVVLLHAAEAPPLPAGVRLRRLVDAARGKRPDDLTHSELLDLIFSADRVICW